MFVNAGHGYFTTLEEITEHEYDHPFDVNVKGALFTVQKFLPLLQQGSRIILTASAVHEKGVPMGSLYFATKAAVRSLGRSLAAELAPRGIRVNTLSPGIVRTNFQESTNIGAAGSETFVQMVIDQAPLQRAGTTNEMAQAALFLASQQSSYMTAADLLIDGGWMSI